MCVCCFGVVWCIGADVGVAMGEGAALSMETSDVTLLDSNLEKIEYMINMGRRVTRKIIENVVFSISVKLIVLAFALSGKTKLWAAIASDVGAMILVTLNSMLLLPKGASRIEVARKIVDVEEPHSPSECMNEARSPSSGSHENTEHKLKACQVDCCDNTACVSTLQAKKTCSSHCHSSDEVCQHKNSDADGPESIVDVEESHSHSDCTKLVHSPSIVNSENTEHKLKACQVDCCDNTACVSTVQAKKTCSSNCHSSDEVCQHKKSDVDDPRKISNDVDKPHSHSAHTSVAHSPSSGCHENTAHKLKACQVDCCNNAGSGVSTIQAKKTCGSNCHSLDEGGQHKKSHLGNPQSSAIPSLSDLSNEKHHHDHSHEHANCPCHGQDGKK
jgi:Zn2+/Cd2+-exporting ATPase